MSAGGGTSTLGGGGGGPSGSGSGGSGGGGGPCGACKFLRRKCVSGCIFAPYFDSEQGAAHFAAVHKVFGASNVSKLLLQIPAHKRLDAVVTICYEAQARLRDPIYGCVSHIFALQQQVCRSCSTSTKGHVYHRHHHGFRLSHDPSRCMGGRNILSFCFLKLHFDQGFICIPFFSWLFWGWRIFFLRKEGTGGLVSGGEVRMARQARVAKEASKPARDQSLFGRDFLLHLISSIFS